MHHVHSLESEDQNRRLPNLTVGKREAIRLLYRVGLTWFERGFPTSETLSINTALHLNISLYMKSIFIYTKYIVIMFADPLSKFQSFWKFLFLACGLFSEAGPTDQTWIHIT